MDIDTSESSLYSLFAQRQSVRKFRPDPVDSEVLRRVIRQAMLAPSATNQQPWDVVMVNDLEESQRISSIAHSGIFVGINKFMSQAPAHLFIVQERSSLLASIGKLNGVNYAPYDVGIFVSHLTMALTSEGLGSCILGWINSTALEKHFKMPRHKKIVLDILVGYSDEPIRPKKRRELSSVLHENTW